MVSSDSIARSLHYAHPGTHDKRYPLRAITRFDADLFANTMCTNPIPMGVLCAKSLLRGN